MSKRKNKQSARSGSAPAPPRPKKKRRINNTPSLVFLGLLLFMVLIIAVSSMFRSGERPECPPGQVWSDAHGHCH